MLREGIVHQEEVLVTPKLTAKSFQSGGLNVLATPALIALMEKTAWKSVLPYMQKGFDTVGTFIEMHHLSPTKIGDKITCISKLISINKKELTFQIEAWDNHDQIGMATHKRFIVDTLSFQQKADKKST